ncbi:MAG: TraX family protein [Enterocloster clostridioformis]
MPSSRKKPETQGGLSGTALKYIAMTAMLADHIGVVLLERIVYYRGGLERVAMLMTSQWGTGSVGCARCSGPRDGLHFQSTAFCWWRDSLHTRDWRRYWLRMAAFALISEIPFRLAVWNTWAGGGCNVYVELAIGLAGAPGPETEPGFNGDVPCHWDGRRRWWRMPGGCLLKADYDMDGILIISLFYLLRDKRPVQGDVRQPPVFSGVLGRVSWDRGSFGGAPAFYNGRKGQARWKYAFYWFYPLHLMALFFSTAVCHRNSSRIIPGRPGLERTKPFWFARGLVL